MQALALGLGWVPWWDSKVLPPVSYDAWYLDTFNTSSADPQHARGWFAYTLRNSTGYTGHDATPDNSGDILRVFERAVTAKSGQKQRAALSFRIQDFQFCNRVPSRNYGTMSPFWYDHRGDANYTISAAPFPDAACYVCFFVNRCLCRYTHAYVYLLIWVSLSTIYNVHSCIYWNISILAQV